jgi:hypothetical protein
MFKEKGQLTNNDVQNTKDNWYIFVLIDYTVILIEYFGSLSALEYTYRQVISIVFCHGI